MSEHNNNHHGKEVDRLSGVETTGHEWDGIRELNNPAPRWWLIVWILCTVWAVGYWFFYPAWPTITDHTKGILGWTEYKELESSQVEIAQRQESFLAKFQDASNEEIQNNPELYAFALAGGAAVFKNNCAVCHGSGAQGGFGFPNLNDDDWLWGGKLSDIDMAVRYGIRSGHDEARQSQMPSFGKDGLLEKQQIEDVVDYVLTLSSEKGADKALPGATVFAENCAVCHGPEGKGDRNVGAPNLSDDIWLYGGDRETVYQTVYNARAGVMPFWTGKLKEDDIRQVSLYIHSLGGGESDTGEPAKTEAVEPVSATETPPASTDGKPEVTQDGPAGQQ